MMTCYCNMMPLCYTDLFVVLAAQHVEEVRPLPAEHGQPVLVTHAAPEHIPGHDNNDSDDDNDSDDEPVCQLCHPLHLGLLSPLSTKHIGGAMMLTSFSFLETLNALW